MRQSNADQERLQADGWGMAFLGNGMKVVKSTAAVFDEEARFRDTVLGTDSKIVLAHLRRASNPMGLDMSEIMTNESTQPFLAQGSAFIHNGTVNFPDRVDLGDHRNILVGKNDSEVLFLLLLKYLEERGNMEKALVALEKSLSQSAPKGSDPFSAINMIFTDGQELHAYCRYMKPAEKGGLCDATRGYYTMCYLPSEERITVMSEPSSDDDGWKDLENGELLSARIVGGAVKHTVRTLA
jgi:predicted glutamine amidotransferase